MKHVCVAPARSKKTPSRLLPHLCGRPGRPPIFFFYIQFAKRMFEGGRPGPRSNYRSHRRRDSPRTNNNVLSEYQEGLGGTDWWIETSPGRRGSPKITTLLLLVSSPTRLLVDKTTGSTVGQPAKTTKRRAQYLETSRSLDMKNSAHEQQARQESDNHSSFLRLMMM